MASPTKKTRKIRERKKTKRGKERKTKNRNQGTTLSRKDLFSK